MKAKAVPERRVATLRRQFNDSFCSPDGQVSLTKVIAIAGQIMLLYYTARYFPEMLAKPETLLVCLSFVIAPDVARKFLHMKYGNGQSADKK